MSVENWLKKNAKDLSNKTVAITGSTGGLGEKLCLHLAKLHANLILLNRNQQKTQAQIDSLHSTYPGLETEFIKLDQTDFKNLCETCELLKKRKIDYLILNAGAYNIPVYETEFGFNNIFQVNFFSPYYLVRHLMPALQQNNSTVVVVGSLACRFAKLNLSDVDCSATNSASKVYGNAKRFLTYSLCELFKEEKSASLIVAHPGVTATNMITHYPKAINWFVKGASKIVFTSPNKASLNILDGLFEKCNYLQWIGPSVCSIWGYPKVAKLPACKESERKQIFAIAEDLYAKFANASV